MRPIVKSNLPVEDDGITQKTYHPYSKAKEDLFDNLGEYCSFCESYSNSSSLAVEHVQAKKCKVGGIEIYAFLEENWDNFLIACVHCNSIKNDSNVILNNFHLPHLNNTFLSINYTTGGSISVNTTLSNAEQIKANRLIKLVGLDRRPGKPKHSKKDNRWRTRRRAWELAERYLVRFNNGEFSDPQIIVEFALERGFWSVWMKVFENHLVVRQALIRGFKGTYADCLTRDIDRN